MDNGLTFPYRGELVMGDGEGGHHPGIGSPGASVPGEEGRRKRPEPRRESDSLRGGSGVAHLPRKALTTASSSRLYSKPTQVGW